MTFSAIDLFAGAGGTSTGLALAAAAIGRSLALAAVNHWETAVATHAANHPWAAHHCAAIDSLDPREVAA
jgi:DNA (cytosine-5)-methyltransferase 1